MSNSKELESQGNRFSQALDVAAKLPGVRIHRAVYLRSALSRYCTSEQIESAIRHSPAAAGIPMDVVTKVANTSIKYETAKVSGISAIAGMPGGLMMAGAIPADLIQYLGHMIRISQKLAYIYSWPELFPEGERAQLDEGTEGLLTLFIGVMFGVQIANGAVTKVAGMVAANVAKKLPEKALTHGVIYPIVKNVSGHLGVNMTKRLFAGGVAKAIPVVGAVLSGGLTMATFLPMSKRLQAHLASLEITKPDIRSSAVEVEE